MYYGTMVPCLQGAVAMAPDASLKRKREQEWANNGLGTGPSHDHDHF